jgi:hypothetical protein
MARSDAQIEIQFQSQATADAFLLLHELGHETGVLGPDNGPGAPPNANGMNSLFILDNCFDITPMGAH